MSFNPYPKTERVKSEKQIGLCKCGKEPISNKHYNLGAFCMFGLKRGITQKEHAKIQKEKANERAKERQKAKPLTPSVSKTKIPFFSEKGAKKAKEVHAAKQKIIANATENDNLFCVNCGINHYTNSHIIAVSQRGDLADDVNNIQLLCISCHSIWGEGTIDKVIRMRNFLKDAEYIYKNDDIRFNKLLNKVLDYEAATKDKFAASIIRAMEKL